MHFRMFFETGLKSSLTKCTEPLALVRLCKSPVGTIHIVATDFNPLNVGTINKKKQPENEFSGCLDLFVRMIIDILRVEKYPILILLFLQKLLVE